MVEREAHMGVEAGKPLVVEAKEVELPVAAAAAPSGPISRVSEAPAG